MANKFDIFISYRRKGGFEVAKHIKDLLERDGYSVSFDIDNLRNGDFNSQLMERISNCKDFILILDAHVFDREMDDDGENLDDGKEDWLISEIAEALKRKKNIIPIMLEGFESFPEKLPDAIKDVRYKNGPKYDREYFDAFYEKLKNFFNDSPSGYEDVGVRGQGDDRNFYTQSILSNLTMAIGASGRQQQILRGRRQETLSLARHPHGHAYREGCPRNRDCADV